MQTTIRPPLIPLADRGPLRVLFAITSMPVGGAETLLVNLVRGMDRERFAPEIGCLKEPGLLADELAAEIPVHARLSHGKWDVRVLFRLRRLIRARRIDAVVTVGAGDKMFWGRLAAWCERLPVVCSALHSTGWPDTIGFLNRRLTGVTDAFIAVAANHGRHLVEREGFPAAKVHVIPNGVDTQRFRPCPESARAVRAECGIPAEVPVVGIVAALRPEKNHELFLQAASRVAERYRDAHFVIVGDGSERGRLEGLTGELGLASRTHFLGTRHDIPRVLAALDVFTLTSHNEANPVSILEALSCGVPVVATRVGSVGETVLPGQTGYLVTPGSAEEVAERVGELIAQPSRRRQFGQAGRALVDAHWSLRGMISGYERLLAETYENKCRPRATVVLSNAAGAGAAGVSRSDTVT